MLHGVCLTDSPAFVSDSINTFRAGEMKRVLLMISTVKRSNLNGKATEVFLRLSADSSVHINPFLGALKSAVTSVVTVDKFSSCISST